MAAGLWTYTRLYHNNNQDSLVTRNRYHWLEYNHLNKYPAIKLVKNSHAVSQARTLRNKVNDRYDISSRHNQ